MKFNFGVPEILMINLVLKLKILNNTSGSDIIRWAIKYSGTSLINNFLKLLKLNKKLIFVKFYFLNNLS